ncbi:MAG TPA: hypothetical protein VJ397_02240 [Thermoplasmata archaeon]|nr:hypothetical protein [Thermoplasmata archaeon]
MTDVVRSDAPRASLAGFIVLIALTALVGLFVVFTIFGLLRDWPQEATALWMGMIFFLLAVLVDVYRRQYMPDEMIHKKRRPKIVYRRAIR